MEVEVIKANNPFDESSKVRKVDRLRVAAYCRVSTDDEDQIKSYNSMVKYYTDFIQNNKQWVFAGVYADKAITGTKVDKREDFQRLIQDCMDGKIDMVIAKSLPRFARNTLDTLKYVRMLKERGIAVYFEVEKINTMKDGEFLMTILSSVAQQEVENTSAYVKKGLKMKMKRGELVGFQGCLGYDYHPEDKSISVNEQEAETVRMIYDLYVQGYGAYTIAKELTRLGKVNKKGEVKWTDSGIRGILKNEKYKGDLLMGKTYTVDPISKRRLDNRGESNKYYTRNHHEPIISEEIWNKAQEIRESRYRTNENVSDGARTKFARKYAFSSMCQCGFCGTNLTRRSHHQDTQHKKPVWKCRTAANKGIENCPHSKAIDEVIIENAFLEMFRLLAENFDDVLESVLSSLETAISKDDSTEKLKRVEKEISTLEKKRKKLTDMYLDDKISKEAYEEKYSEWNHKLDKCEEEKLLFSANALSQKNIASRMKTIRAKLKNADVTDEFDRLVFESIVEKVIVGEIAEDGSTDPYKLTFVLKGMDDCSVPDARNRDKNLHKQAV